MNGKKQPRKNLKFTLSYEEVKNSKIRKSINRIKKRRYDNVWSKRFVLSKDKVLYSKEKIENCIKGLNNGKIEIRKKSIKYIRKILSQKDCEKDIVEMILNTPNFDNYLLKNLTCKDSVEIQTEIVWCISNICSFNHVHRMLKFSPYLILYLSTAHMHLGQKSLATQCFYALSNIALDSYETREVLIKQGIIKPLSRNLHLRCSFLDLTLWCLSCVVRVNNQKLIEEFYRNLVGKKIVKLLIYYVSKIIKNETLTQKQGNNLVETLWIIVNLTNINNYSDFIIPLINLDNKGNEKDLLSAIIILILKLNREDTSVPALRILGNVLAGPNKIIDGFFKLPSHDKLVKLLLMNLQTPDITKKFLLIKDSAHVLGNIAGGTTKHVQYLVNLGIIPILCKLFSNATYDLKREIMYILINISSDGTWTDTIFLKYEGLKGFLTLLSFENANLEVKRDVLKFLLFLTKLYYTKKNKYLFILFEKFDGVDILEKLCVENDKQVESMASFILSNYFQKEEEDNFSMDIDFKNSNQLYDL